MTSFVNLHKTATNKSKMFKTSTKRTQEDELPDVARFMPRVYEDDDIDVDGGNDLNDDLDASNEEEVNVKEEEEEEKEEKVVEAAAVTVKKSKSKRIEEEELRPEEQGCSE